MRLEFSFLPFLITVIILIVILGLEITCAIKKAKQELDDFYNYLDSEVNFEDYKYLKRNEEFTKYLPRDRD